VTARRENTKARMRRLARAAIAEAMADHAASYAGDRNACVAVKAARHAAADAIVDLVWDWFEVRERKRKK
jgi:hypothetical protein